MPNRYTGPAPVEHRFWSKVDKSGDCWLWTAGKTTHGYGIFARPGGTTTRFTMAHRFAWELTNGPIPAGMHLCHRCDTPACVRPEHLFVGTRADNMQDAKAKGRFAVGTRSGAYLHRARRPRGERHQWAKLTDAQADEIRVRRGRGETVAAIASAFGVSIGLVSMIANGKRRAS